MVGNFDLKSLYSAIDDERSRRELTWSGVAKEIEEQFMKVSPSTIQGVGDRLRVEGDGVLQILLWLGRAPENFVRGDIGDLLPLRPAQPGKVLRWDAASIFSALDQKRDGSNLTWRAVADEIGGVTPQQLKGMAKGGRTFLPEVMRIAVWLGVPVSNLTRESAI
ncbi:MAG: hypothetical protein O2856_10805 [Planctomycetota bacterium]|nr:hypothetical protein [Planctomycetota bacterium]